MYTCKFSLFSTFSLFLTAVIFCFQSFPPSVILPLAVFFLQSFSALSRSRFGHFLPSGILHTFRYSTLGNSTCCLSIPRSVILSFSLRSFYVRSRFQREAATIIAYRIRPQLSVRQKAVATMEDTMVCWA